MTQTTDRRTDILHSAADLFAAQGVASSTVRQIADQVGMLSGSLYHHFPSKDAIVGEILTRYLDRLLASYDEVLAADLPSRGRLERLILVSLREAERSPSSTIVYQNEMTYIRSRPGFDAVKAATTRVQSTWMSVIEAGRADGSFRTDIDPKIFYRFVRDAVWLSIRWYRRDGANTVDALAEVCSSLFLDGYAAFDDD